MFLRRKKSKRNRKPFQRFDEANYEGIASYEWFVFFVLIAIFVINIYYFVKLIWG